MSSLRSVHLRLLINSSLCMQWCKQMSNKHYCIDDTWLLKCTQCMCSLKLCCNNTRPIYTPHHMSDVQYSWFLCCTKFLFSVLYKIPFFQWCTIFLISVMYNTPVFCDVQYSWFQWCTIFLYSAMYNIPVFHVVPFSCIISDVP